MSSIKGTRWYTRNSFINDKIEAEAEHRDGFSVITLSKGTYSLTRIISEVDGIKENFYYNIKVDTEAAGEEIDIDILEAYFNADGKELLHQYITDERPSLAPVGAVRLEISLLARGSLGGTVKAYIPTVSELKPYEKREVTLAAVTLDTHSVKDRARAPQDNIDEALAKIDMLCKKERKPDVVLFTERFHTMGITYNHLSDSFITIDSDYVKAMQKKAREHGIYICFSMREVDSEGYYYNSAPLIDREGNIVINYHKTHLTMGELAMGLKPGDEIAVYDTDFGRVGIAICWDMFFGDYISLLRDKGVELILNPSLGYWDDINSMRAEDTGAYILTAGGLAEKTAILRPEGNTDSTKVVDYGNIIDKADMPKHDGIVYATVDLNERFPVRYLSANSAAERRSVYKNEARPDLYGKYRN